MQSKAQPAPRVCFTSHPNPCAFKEASALGLTIRGALLHTDSHVDETCLIGCPGFVGSTLLQQHEFTRLYHSGNVSEIRGSNCELIVCAAPSAAKWLANQNPDADRASVETLAEHLSCVRAESAVLISTIDVYPHPRDVDESADCSLAPNHAYGRNRLLLETRLREAFPNLHVIRLSGLFGKGLKKNVIFDLINDNCLDLINPNSIFQYYDLSCLWDDLQIIRKHDIPLLNLVAEPLPTSAILDVYFPGKQVGLNAAPKAAYDVQTCHAGIFGRDSRYRFDAGEVLERLGRFINSESGGGRT